MIVSPSMSGKYSIPLLRSNPEVFDGFIAVSPVNTASLSATEYKAIQVRERNIVFGLISTSPLISTPHLSGL